MTGYINGNLARQYDNETSNINIKQAKNKVMPKREKLFFIFSVLFVVLLSGIIISGYAQITELNYEAQKVEKSITSMNEENENLQRKIAELSTPERILKIARDELGMSLNEKQVLVITK